MAKRKKPAVDEGAQAVLEGAEEFVRVDGLSDEPQSAVPRPELKERLSLPIDPATGAIDVKGMRAATIEKLRAAALLTPDLFPSAAASRPELQLADGAIDTLWSFIGRIEMMVAAKWLETRQLPPQLAVAFGFTAEEVDYLRDPTKRLIAKHFSRIKRFEVEAEFCMVVASAHIQKNARLREMIAHVVAENRPAKTPEPEGPMQ